VKDDDDDETCNMQHQLGTYCEKQACAS
jgi:hypothetical protein